jgi:murein DD-endopeptidase MepM/ murein hydrolase activator NlpD
MAQNLQGTLIKSTIGVDKIKKSVMTFNKSINSTQKTAIKINTSLSSSNRQKQQSIRLSVSNFQKRREAVRRREREDIIEASGISGAIRRQGKVISSSTKGFLGRILDFIGTLMVGWLLNNLPTIIRLGEQLITRMGKLYVVLRSFVGNVTSILSGFGSLLTGTSRNLIAFDFSTQKQLIDSSLSTIQNGMIGIEMDFNRAIDLLSQPLDLGFDELDIPEEKGKAPPAAPDNVPGGTSGTGLPSSQSPEMFRIAAALSTEGSGKQSVADMMQVVVNRKAMGTYGNTYTDILAASGQFEGVQKRGSGGFRKIQTLEDASKWSGQSQAALLGIIKNIQDQSLQASAAKFVAGALEFRGSPATVRSVNSDSNPRNNIQSDSSGRIPGSVWRGGNGDNQFITSNPPGAIPLPIRKGGAAPFNLPAPVAPSTPLPRSRVKDEINVSGPSGGTPDVGLSREAGAQYGAYRSDTRSHAGIDIGTSGQKGWLVGFKRSGTVIRAGNGGGYGNLVVIKSGNTEYYFAHLARIFVKLGPYNGEVIGEIGKTGGDWPIHLHYEVRPNGRPIDPKPYLNLLDIGRTTVADQTAAKPATLTGIQIASAKPSTTQVAAKITPERTGKPVVVPIPEIQVAQAPQQVQSSSGGGLNVSVDKSGLNRYIEQSQYFSLA